MHPLSLTKKHLPDEIVEAEICSITEKIKGACKPLCAILFGSAAEGKMTDQSDLDILLVFQDLAELRLARKAIAALAPISSYPTDILYIELNDYLRKRELGGVCMIAHEDGRCLLGNDPP